MGKNPHDDNVVILSAKFQGQEVGILGTPCFPASLYVGYIHRDRDGKPYPAANDTFYWHRDEESAINALTKRFPGI